MSWGKNTEETLYKVKKSAAWKNAVVRNVLCIASFSFVSPRYTSADPRRSASLPRTLLANAAGLPFFW